MTKSLRASRNERLVPQYFHGDNSRMITVNFPPHLRRFIEVPDSCAAEGSTLREVLNDLENQFPGVSGYLLHENGTLRQHVNLFLDQRLCHDRENLDQSIADVEELTVMQALSGG